MLRNTVSGRGGMDLDLIFQVCYRCMSVMYIHVDFWVGDGGFLPFFISWWPLFFLGVLCAMCVHVAIM